MTSRFKAAVHETRCKECRVTWYSWVLRVTGIGGTCPRASDWRRSKPPVKCKGQAIGTVESVTVDETGVKVTMELNDIGMELLKDRSPISPTSFEFIHGPSDD